MPKDMDNDEGDQASTSDVGMIYKSLMNRGPTKRKIKPVASILNSFTADIGDSESDDSDYMPTNMDDDDIEIESDAEEDDKQKQQEGEHSKKNGDAKSGSKSSKSSKSGSSKHSSSDSDSDSSGSSSSSGSSKSSSSKTGSAKKKKKAKASLAAEGKSNEPQVNTATDNQPTSEQQQKKVPPNFDKIRICSVCLGDVSRNFDEIVECDSCGISVHELCYGITADDAESIHSDASSASTEPWFCDPCKADVRTPLCELCPNSGGIFKITDSGRWVHMVCALFTHGISFVDVERLRGPVISEIQSNRWGTKVCSLCEDQRFSQTGVCMHCDAGMCKTFFHVTCAQREGFLCFLRNSDEIDPYIAYCRLHSDRHGAKQKKKNYLALVAKNKLVKNALEDDPDPVDDQIHSQRILNKLFKQREKFQNTFQEIEATNSGASRRVTKYLDASPSVIRRLSSKGENMGLKVPNAPTQEDYTDIRKKWFVPAAFSCEFVSYYLDRNDRIRDLQERSHELIEKNKHLKITEEQIRNSIENLNVYNNQTKAENDQMRQKIRQYLSVIEAFRPKVEGEGNNWIEQILNLPEMSPPKPEINLKHFSAQQSQLHPQQQSQLKKLHQVRQGNLFAKPGTSSSSSPNKKADKIRRRRSSGSKDSISKQTFIAAVPVQENECATCKVIKEQHLLALCDSCHLYYHLYCLDPPLRRMPKKTRFGGWQCSNCTEKAQDEEEERNEMNLLEYAHSSSNNSRNVSPSGAASGDGATPGSGRSGTRKLRENPKAATKYENEDTSTTGTISASGATSTPGRGRPRGSSAKRGRKPKPVANLSNNDPPQEPMTAPLVTYSRKRRLSSSQDRVSIDTGSANGDNNSVGGLGSPGQVSLDSSASSSKQSTSPAKRASLTFLCAQCNSEAQSKTSVKCDNCENNYHFSCLVPPCSKSPKRRGYTWCCHICEKKGEKRDTSHQEGHESKKKTATVTEVGGGSSSGGTSILKREGQDINDIESQIVMNNLKTSVAVLATKSSKMNGVGNDEAHAGDQRPPEPTTDEPSESNHTGKPDVEVNQDESVKNQVQMESNDQGEANAIKPETSISAETPTAASVVKEES